MTWVQICGSIMKKEILKDKFGWSLILIIPFTLFVLKSPSHWLELLIQMAIIISFIGFIVYQKADFYLQSFMANPESVTLRYHKNFSEAKILESSISRKSIISINFISNSSSKGMHKVSIKYLNENDSYEKMTVKIIDDIMFIQLVHTLKLE